MSNGFPPIPVYPKGYDDDSTLYLVYNTAESIIVLDNPAWSEEITIKPVGADKNEIWASNGYANIEGELFYYDLVEKDDNGKVFKFKRCVRNLGGTKTKNNLAGSEVRGYVIAEHHNQLADAIIKIENFIGEDDSDDETTIDWRLKDLINVETIYDDHTCPEITFSYTILENKPATGVLISYNIVIDGQYTAFRLDFGDGESTTNAGAGQHRYSVNSTIDPLITISNKKCSTVQSPSVRNNPTEPPTIDPFTTFDLAIPTIPNIPPIIIPDFVPPTNAFNIPPIVFPCLDIGGFGSLNIPSLIVVDSPFDLPSIITITPVEIPSEITIIPYIIPDVNITPFAIPDVAITPYAIPDVAITPYAIPDVAITPFAIPDVQWTEPPLLIVEWTYPPSLIIEWSEPPLLIVDWSEPPSLVVEFAETPSLVVDWSETPSLVMDWSETPSLVMDWSETPSFVMDWGTPPTLSCVVSIVCPSSGGLGFKSRTSNLEDGFSPILDSVAESVGLNIPEEIRLIVPKIPDIRVIHDIPEIIRVEKTDIKLDVYDLPKSIPIDASMIPLSIKLEPNFNFPTIILVDGSSIPDTIQVVGIPPTIELVSKINGIQLLMPEKPEIEMVYKGGPVPIELKISLDNNKITSDGNCFSLVPCGK